jgi:hypothetical protein
MFSDLIAFIVATFLLGPLQAEMTERLDAAQAPREVTQQVVRCATDATPRLIERGVGNPKWVVGTVVRIWTGMIQPEAVLRDAAPSCPAAMTAAAPFFVAGS